MVRPMILMGDVLDTLRECSAGDGVAYLTGGAPESRVPADARTVVVGVDLRDVASRGVAKARLKIAGQLAAETVRHGGAVRHAVIATTLDPHMVRYFDRLASALATRLHSDLERAAGRDVEVTLLDVSRCENGRALFDRLRERSDDPSGSHGVVVLNWDDIRSRSIARAATLQYV